MIQRMNLYAPAGKSFDMLVVSDGQKVVDVEISGNWIYLLYSSVKKYLSSDAFKQDLTQVIGKQVSYVVIGSNPAGNPCIEEIKVYEPLYKR